VAWGLIWGAVRVSQHDSTIGIAWGIAEVSRIAR
jgi:hypothetical protein